ncbi:MAG: hypothetical protein A2849_04125 [Candidatus Taylorbacteria bacterium RIFCSPHIGHO2_01_FULL_51_15]|uniref:EfeO-type cupredoxin-like domain-containing protein n=1 Tax=Candidatus Taylorbacteria bacterium RIFCSPHIGHO2_01_FULL_51_15 TaxID=1802304 RepID=A0A1G2M8I9_9BACT|nr:MAG: hypothetical protein A2849_04125 [Candidatus Taylorbacteria bacterium RIFCSPHIGHO2_01_FULL_51_15]
MTARIISVVIALTLIGGALFLTNRTPGLKDGTRENVSFADGTQIIDISAEGGYSPRLTLATANVPTVLRVNSGGLFSCASALTIPKLGVRANLSPSETRDFTVPPQPQGSVLQGICAMGMYSFSIRFD